MCAVHVERLGHGGDGLGLITEGLENGGHGGGQSAESLASHCGRMSDRYIYYVRRASRRRLMENRWGDGETETAVQVYILGRSASRQGACWVAAFPVVRDFDDAS